VCLRLGVRRQISRIINAGLIAGGDQEVELIEPTFRRSLAIWWSFAWRAFVLWMPVVVVLMGVMFAVVPFENPGEPPDSAEIHRAMIFMPIVWAGMMVGIVVTQTFAMQWMLKSQRWPDYIVALIPADDPRR